ncbi:hypothetical protein Anas_08257 [Armadillidium nasatum]|uniref:Uncharacterized protein n=1 Tax=Armadillidium nasatum TaxID=96803 RepID=A0A5N5SPT4_9CRUS|nr:hypothetical protein Anas_08257 [Armadillidium nasatum]
MFLMLRNYLLLVALLVLSCYFQAEGVPQPYGPYGGGGYSRGGASASGGFVAGGGSVDAGHSYGPGPGGAAYSRGGAEASGGFVAGGGSVSGGGSRGYYGDENIQPPKHKVN